MKKIDSILQVLIIIAVAISFIPYGLGGVFMALYAQAFLGIYQPISALVRWIYRKRLPERLRILLGYYWGATLGYIALSILFFGGKEYLYDFFGDVLHILGIFWIMIVPWIIALFYTYISYQHAFGERTEQRSKFLPNINL